MKHQKLSPENYLKTHARLLPLGECYINKSWKESGMASIVVARKHVTGFLTFALFQVDLYCLGVKNAIWRFNESPLELDDIISRQSEFSPDDPFLKAEYKLVHNIIYGAEAFADDLGFRPHKDFKLAQYVLEEDDEKIELIDIEFGLYGQPAIFLGREEHPSNILAVLDKSVGPGNYTIIDEEHMEDVDEEDQDDEEFDEDSTDEDKFDGEDIGHEVDGEDNILKKDFFIEKPLEEYSKEDFEQILHGKRAMNPESKFVFGFALAREIIGKKENKQIDKILHNIEKWMINEDDAGEEDQFATDEEKHLYYRLYEEMTKDVRKAIPAIKQAIIDHPDSFNLHNLLGIAYVEAKLADELFQVSEELFRKFPGNIVATCNYLNRLILNDRISEAEQLVHLEYDIHKQFTGKSNYLPLEYLSYLSVLINYTLAKGEPIKAAAYAYGLTLMEWTGAYQDTADELYLTTTAELYKLLVPKDLFNDISRP